MAHCSRRNFLKTGLAASMLAAAGRVPLRAARGTATDWVTLGRSGVKVTRLAFGTGSISGRIQRELGQDEFTRLVRHAYDSGVRFFETAESYGDMHRMLGVALKGIPRDSYRLMSKVTTREGVNPQDKIDELRKLANTDYFDVMLLHWQHTATWPTDTVRWQDGILEAESKHAEFGLEGVKKVMQARPATARDLSQSILQSVQDFMHMAPKHNDVTALTLIRAS